jgi:hypothetical protein
MFRVAPAIAASALLAGAVFATPMAASAVTTPDPTPSPAATGTDSAAPDATDAAEPSGVGLAVSPAGNGVLAAGSDLTVTVEISNPGPDTVPAGTVEIVLDRTPLASADAYGAWLAGAQGSAQDSGAGEAEPGDAVDVVSAPTVAVPLGATHTQQVTVPAAQLGLAEGGVYGIGATLTVDGESEAGTRSTIVVTDAATAALAPAGVTVIAPITSVASSTGLIPAAALEASTNENGILTRELDAVVGRPVTIAVDPRIIVSIRALGSTAPASAVAWLEQLDAAPNAIIPLTFGDSDIAGEHQAGAPSVLAPTSFSYALDPANFTNVDELIEPSAPATAPATVTGTPAAGAGAGAATSSGTSSDTSSGSGDDTPTGGDGAATDPDPQPTPDPPAVPTLEQLTAWDYTATSIAWPRSGSIVAGDLPFFAQSGLTTSIVDSAQLVPAEGASAPLEAAAKAGDQNVLVADHGVSLAFQDALAASSDTRRGEAVAELAGSLAIAAGASGASGTSGTAGAGDRQVLAVLDRTTMNLGAIDQVLGAMLSLPWASPDSLDSLLAQTPEQVVTVIDTPESAERIGQIGALLASGQRIDAFSSVLDDPLALTGEYRADLLALLSNSWSANEGGWNVAVQTNQEATEKTLASVQVVDGSSINMVANQANLPVTINNDLPYPVNVILHVTPSNGRLVVEKTDVEVTIEATSRKGAQIPLEAGVANGPVTLSFQLLSPTGVLLSTPSPVVVNVSADWETWGTVIVAVLVVALFGFGIVRNILRRRKKRRNGDADAGGSDTDDPDDADPNAPLAVQPTVETVPPKARPAGEPRLTAPDAHE